MIMLRTPLARSLYNHAVNSHNTQCPVLLPQKHYVCNLNAFNGRLRDAWVRFDCDEPCQEFLRHSCAAAASFCLQLIYSFVLTCLKPFVSRTTVNGLLGRGSMYVLSTQQFQQLRHHGKNQIRNEGQLGSLLDVGAGDGQVTKHLAPLFREVFATEMSPPMRWRLKSARFKVLPMDDWGGRQFDMISCLNVLDRCQRPLRLLQSVRESLVPGGLLLVGMVLPLHQCVENGAQMVSAKESLPYCTSHSWEENVKCVVEELFAPAGFQLRSFSRVPYLSEGDLAKPYYVLDEALLLFQVPEVA